MGSRSDGACAGWRHRHRRRASASAPGGRSTRTSSDQKRRGLGGMAELPPPRTYRRRRERRKSGTGRGGWGRGMVYECSASGAARPLDRAWRCAEVGEEAPKMSGEDGRASAPSARRTGGATAHGAYGNGGGEGRRVGTPSGSARPCFSTDRSATGPPRAHARLARLTRRGWESQPPLQVGSIQGGVNPPDRRTRKPGRARCRKRRLPLSATLCSSHVMETMLLSAHLKLERPRESEGTASDALT